MKLLIILLSLALFQSTMAYIPSGWSDAFPVNPDQLSESIWVDSLATTECSDIHVQFLRSKIDHEVAKIIYSSPGGRIEPMEKTIMFKQESMAVKHVRMYSITSRHYIPKSITTYLPTFEISKTCYDWMGGHLEHRCSGVLKVSYSGVQFTCSMISHENIFD